MRLAWLAANASYAHVSLALPLLERACASLSQVEWHAVQGTTKDSVQDVTTRLATLQPQVATASLYLFNRRFVGEVFSRLKTLRPDCLIVVGGPECLGDHAELLRQCPWIDVAVRGEGEAVLPQLLRSLLANESPPFLPGVSQRLGGKIRTDSRTAVSLDWPDHPLPEFSPLFAWTRPFVQIETARGCAFHCTYCTSCDTQPVRVRALDSVRRQLDMIQTHGITEIRVLDRTFNTSPKRTAALLDLFAEFPGMRFHLEIHPAMLGAEVRRRLAAVAPGTLHVEAGLQSAHDTCLRAVHRSGSGAEALSGIDFLVHCADRFETHVDLLAGLPQQSLSQVLHDVLQLMQLGPAEIQLEILKALPGTPFCRQAVEQGILVSPLPPYEVLSTPDMSAGDLLRISTLSRLVDQFYNAPPLRPILRLALKTDPGILAELLQHCLDTGLLAAPISLRRRFESLFAFLQPRCSRAADMLQITWMELGLGQESGICRAERWKGPLPEGARLLRGEDRGLTADKARIWHLRLAHGACWVVYYRGDSSGRAGAIFQQ